MRSRFLSVPVVALVASLFAVANASADTILTSTMGATNDDWSGFSNTNWSAAPFQTTATLTRITAIELGLGLGGYAGGDFFVEIKESIAGAAGPGGHTGPGGSTWSVFSGSLTGGTMTFTGLSLNLLPNSQYFVVVGGASLNDSEGFFGPQPGFIAWNMHYAPTPHTGDGFVEGTWFGTDYSTQWNPTTTYSPLMSITAEASSAVPEIDPAGAGSVLPLVAGALAMLERRRRA